MKKTNTLSLTVFSLREQNIIVVDEVENNANFKTHFP